MKNPEIWIENTEARGKNVALHTKVYLLRWDDHGNEEKIDISSLVRAADVRLHIGEVVTAKLDVYITGFESRASLETLLIKELDVPRKGWRRRLREVTTFGSGGQREYAA